jgi:hypothetical protein
MIQSGRSHRRHLAALLTMAIGISLLIAAARIFGFGVTAWFPPAFGLVAGLSFVVGYRFLHQYFWR